MAGRESIIRLAQLVDREKKEVLGEVGNELQNFHLGRCSAALFVVVILVDARAAVAVEKNMKFQKEITIKNEENMRARTQNGEGTATYAALEHDPVLAKPPHLPHSSGVNRVASRSK